jgi:hypothetical protein
MAGRPLRRVRQNSELGTVPNPIRNLTPHPIAIDGWVNGPIRVVILPDPAGPARVQAGVGELEGALYEPGYELPIPVYGPDTFGRVTGLPAHVPGTWLLVSAMVGAAAVDRFDLLVPGTGPGDGAVRDEKGQIVAVTRLKRAR